MNEGISDENIGKAKGENIIFIEKKEGDSK